jgi:predicted esterase
MKNENETRETTSLRQGYGGPPKLQRRRKGTKNTKNQKETTPSPFGLRGLRVLCGFVALALSNSIITAQHSSALDRAFADFWKADDSRGAERAAERILKAGADFDSVYARLKAGRTYGKEQTGAISMRFPAGAGVLFENVVDVPVEYTPSRTWSMRVQLHGGVMRRSQATIGGGGNLEGDEPSGGGGGAPNLSRRRQENRIPGEPQIYVFPSGSGDAAWWHAHQVDNILRVVDRLKRRYNVDESRIYLTGISDGGTGIYYMAMREPTVWSAFLPLNGSIKVLGNPSLRVDGELYANNLVNRPLYIVNGGRDPLYPADHIATHVEIFKSLGVSLVFRPQATAGHDTSWWQYERGLFEQFVKHKPRPAHPEKISWETERADRFNRADWLLIDRLGSGSSDASFETVDVFEHKRPSGRVDISRSGNAFVATSRGVRQFTLLLSPDAIDFTQPVAVTVNGTQAFRGTLEKDAAILLKWGARDADRTRLFAAELKVQVP